MIFKINKIELITSAKGTQYAKAVIVNEQGHEYSNVTVFSPNSLKKVGETMIGELTPNDYQGKVGWKFQEEKTNTLTKAMETKAENIKVAQENRAEGVKIASTFRDASLITSHWMTRTDVPFPTDEDVQNKWLYWRSWLWKHWDDEQ